MESPVLVLNEPEARLLFTEEQIEAAKNHPEGHLEGMYYLTKKVKFSYEENNNN